MIVESSAQASLDGLLTHSSFKKKVKGNIVPPPPPVEVKLESTYSLFFDGAYKRAMDKVMVGIVVYDSLGAKVFSLGIVLESSHSNNEAKY